MVREKYHSMLGYILMKLIMFHKMGDVSLYALQLALFSIFRNFEAISGKKIDCGSPCSKQLNYFFNDNGTGKKPIFFS